MHYLCRYSATTKLIHNHFSSIQQPRSNYDSTILRGESKNDSDTTIPHPIFSNHNSTTRKRIREAVAECEAYARPARTTRSLRAPRRHDFDALGLAFASAWLARIASPACAAVTPLYAPPCFSRRKSTPTLLFGFTQNDTLAAWGFNYNEA